MIEYFAAYRSPLAKEPTFLIREPRILNIFFGENWDESSVKETVAVRVARIFAQGIINAEGKNVLRRCPIRLKLKQKGTGDNILPFIYFNARFATESVSYDHVSIQ